MNSSGYHEMKSSRKRTTHNSIEKNHVHDRFESAQVPFNQGSRKGRKFNAGYYIAEILESFSQWRSIEVAGNK
jgi:NADH:ubiquinone oxidoreductase subunit 3 (subunit A)